jgi:hypothetical protein
MEDLIKKFQEILNNLTPGQRKIWAIDYKGDGGCYHTLEGVLEEILTTLTWQVSNESS